MPDVVKNVLLALLAVVVLASAGYAVTTASGAVTSGAADAAGASGTLESATSPRSLVGLTCAFLGDSYSAGEGASRPAAGMAALAARHLGCRWIDDSQASTGYVTANRQIGGAPFGERLAAALADRPSLLILAGGTTDATLHAPLAAVRARSQAAIAMALAQQTTRRLVVLGPWWPTPNPSPDVLAVRDAVRANAVRDGVVFLDPIAERWVASASDAATFIRAGTVYPTDAGYADFARRLVADLKRRNRLPIA